jgi:predicted Ser/Thr protein kinase
MGDTRGSAFTHQISPEPAAVLGLFFVLLTILCFLLLSRVKNKHPLRVKLLYIGLLTAIILRTTFFISAVFAGALFEEGLVAEEVFYVLWAMPHFIFFLIFTSVVYFTVDVFTISHDYFFFSNLRNRKIFFAGEITLVVVFIIAQTILFFIPAERDIEFWIKTSLYGFGVMQVVLVLMCLVFMAGLKIGLNYQGRKWLKTRAKFRQLYVTCIFWWFGMALRGFSTVISTAFSWELLFSPTADWLYWLLLGIVYLISEWFPLLLLLDNTLLMIITTYTMAFALEQQVEEDKEREHLLAGIEQKMTRVIKRSNLYISRSEKLGEGAFGVVYKGKYDGKPVAVKIIKNADVELAFIEEFGKEVEALASVSHPNIVKFIGACLELPHIAIITEYVHPGSLRKILDNELIDISEDNILKMSIDICKAMIYLHEKGFVHRDLKTDNLLVDENWNIKVTDFGLARFINERKQSNNIAKTNNIGT